ncbi:MAG: hypothetical protein ACXWKT_20515 [Caulobacteraceae bacterium]
MFRRVFEAFTHPWAGPVGFALSLIMCGLLIATSLTAARTEAQLRARITELARQDARTGALLYAKLAACESALPPGPGGAAAPGTIQDRAQRLASRGPEGFDVCARMESADRAVLENLR